MKSQTFKYWEDSFFESLLGKHLKICYLKEKNRLNKLSVTANDNSQNRDFSFSFEVQKRDCHNNNKDATIPVWNRPLYSSHQLFACPFNYY